MLKIIKKYLISVSLQNTHKFLEISKRNRNKINKMLMISNQNYKFIKSKQKIQTVFFI